VPGKCSCAPRSWRAQSNRRARRVALLGGRSGVLGTRRVCRVSAVYGLIYPPLRLCGAEAERRAGRATSQTGSGPRPRALEATVRRPRGPGDERQSGHPCGCLSVHPSLHRLIRPASRQQVTSGRPTSGRTSPQGARLGPSLTRAACNAPYRFARNLNGTRQIIKLYYDAAQFTNNSFG
jgi:hypothetical protein